MHVQVPNSVAQCRYSEMLGAYSGDVLLKGPQVEIQALCKVLLLEPDFTKKVQTLSGPTIVSKPLWVCLDLLEGLRVFWTKRLLSEHQIIFQ
jgi:hypothetical protein